MATLPTSPPSISTFPQAPNSGTDTPSEFDTKANNFVSAQVSYVPEANSLSAWIESTATQVYNNAVEAANSVTDAEQQVLEATNQAELSKFYSDISKNSSNLLGEWSSLTGSASIGDVAAHLGARWQAVVDIPDIAASEPSLSNSDWLIIDSESKSTPVADGDTLSAFIVNELQATQSNPLPLASSVPVNTRLRISVPNSYRGIITTHLASGSDTTTDSTGNSDGFIFNWINGGAVTLISDGVSNWRY